MCRLWGERRLEVVLGDDTPPSNVQLHWCTIYKLGLIIIISLWHILNRVFALGLDITQCQC